MLAQQNTEQSTGNETEYPHTVPSLSSFGLQRFVQCFSLLREKQTPIISFLVKGVKEGIVHMKSSPVCEYSELEWTPPGLSNPSLN